MKYTFSRKYEAHYGLTGDRICIVPDQVVDNQPDYEGKTFPALVTGKPRRARLIGDDYGLYSSGTGDMVVRPA